MTQHLLVISTIFAAVFTQTTTGFGFALISMPILVPALGWEIAAPLAVLIGFTNQAIMLTRYHTSFNIRAVRPLLIASLLGISLGIWALQRIEAHFIIVPLGFIITGYALYALHTPNLPPFEHPAWAYGFGFVAGLLGGAYNTNGPPIIIYGNAHKWSPSEFKSNIPGFFLVNNIVLVITHALAGRLTPPLWESCAVALPALGVAMAAGFWLDRYIDAERFRRIVLLLLIGVGLNLIRQGF